MPYSRSCYARFERHSGARALERHPEAQLGAVSFFHRFGSSLNVHPHYHPLRARRRVQQGRRATPPVCDHTTSLPLESRSSSLTSVGPSRLGHRAQEPYEACCPGPLDDEPVVARVARGEPVARGRSPAGRDSLTTIPGYAACAAPAQDLGRSGSGRCTTTVQRDVASGAAGVLRPPRARGKSLHAMRFGPTGRTGLPPWFVDRQGRASCLHA